MKKTIAIAVAALFASATASAASTWGNIYSDVLINDFASKKESQIIGIEGGIATDTGTELYGFFEHNPDLENEFGKLTIHSSLVGDFGVYAHGTMFKEGDFSENAYLLGAGYQGLNGEGWSVKPYVGVIRIDAGEDNTIENAAFGYAGFMALENSVVLSSWVDARVDEHKVKAKGSVGIQKDIAMYPGAYVGAFYNMNYHEAGVKGYSDSVQLRVGYHF